MFRDTNEMWFTYKYWRNQTSLHQHKNKNKTYWEQEEIQNLVNFAVLLAA